MSSKAELREQLESAQASKAQWRDAWKDEHDRRHALEGEVARLRAQVAELSAQLASRPAVSEEFGRVLAERDDLRAVVKTMRQVVGLG